MKKSGMTGMELHQALSFFPFMMRIPETEAVFWPGCALLNLEGELLEKTLTVLRRVEPDIGLCACCCGQPTAYLFPDKIASRQEQLVALLKQRGVKRIYTVCPNCSLQLKQLGGFDIQSVWPVLAKQLRPEDCIPSAGSYIWHDPCPTKRDPEQQKAVRKLLAISGCDYCEPEHTGSNTICCGNFHMLHTLRPETSSTMRQRRLAEFPEERTILSSCEGCLGAFRGEGRQTLHLLELLFGVSGSRSWGNRIKTTLKQK